LPLRKSGWEENKMNNERFYEAIDPARVALVLGLSIGLGIVVHEGFFLVAGAIAVGAAAATIANAIHDHHHAAQLFPHHR